MPLPETPHGYLTAFCITFYCSPPITTLVLFTFTLISGDATLELVDKFCYLDDMLSVDGDADASVETRIRIAWNKFRQLVTLLTNKDISLTVRGRLYSSCVRSSMLHGSENEVALQRAEMRMVRWMCDVKLQDRVLSTELRRRLGIDDINSVLQQNRL